MSGINGNTTTIRDGVEHPYMTLRCSGVAEDHQDHAGPCLLRVSGNGACVSKKVFESGATRSDDVGPLALHLIPWEGVRLWAESMEGGRIAHGAKNWQGGFPISECLNHAIRHIFLFAEGGETYHIGNAMANLGFIAHFLKHRPDLDDR